jgi:predicted nucleotidyltransferase
MDRTRLLEYVRGYDRRRAARLAEVHARAHRARALAPELADLCRQYGARGVRLFGSLVTGRYGLTPDIDLAVDDLPPERFFDLLAALQIRAAPIEVDLVNTATAPPELRYVIESEGKPI